MSKPAAMMAMAVEVVTDDEDDSVMIVDARAAPVSDVSVSAAAASESEGTTSGSEPDSDFEPKANQSHHKDTAFAMMCGVNGNGGGTAKSAEKAAACIVSQVRMEASCFTRTVLG